jgi:spore germination cell wall hydrolase CwlJ-like protein
MNKMDWPLPPETQAGSPEQAEPPEREPLFFAKAGEAPDPLGIVDHRDKPWAVLRSRRKISSRRAGAIMGGAAVAGLLLFATVRVIDHRGDGLGGSVGNSLTVKVPPIDLPPPNLLRPISPEEAVKENAERPFVNRPDTAARRFMLQTDADDRAKATNCLTQAVYYEAASEGEDGERAVAQVVLNRMRHPGFPSTVCGVVYQGAERGSGCQFTFVCDGSLLRTPVASLWARARKIAEQALAGRVFAPVGHATHYHADYVLPYWADSLDKSVQIGRHIFYRLPSVLGDSRSFFQRYSGKEPDLPKPPVMVTDQPSASTDALASVLTGNTPEKTPEVEKAGAPVVPLAVDASHGTLLADEQAPTIAAHHPKPSSECATSSDRKQIGPLGANDLRAGVSSTGC